MVRTLNEAAAATVAVEAAAGLAVLAGSLGLVLGSQLGDQLLVALQHLVKGRVLVYEGEQVTEKTNIETVRVF